MVVYSWQAVAAHARLPEKVEARLESALQSPEVKTRFEDMGLEMVANTGAEFETFLGAEIARWTGRVEAGTIAPEQ